MTNCQYEVRILNSQNCACVRSTIKKLLANSSRQKLDGLPHTDQQGDKIAPVPWIISKHKRGAVRKTFTTLKSDTLL